MKSGNNSDTKNKKNGKSDDDDEFSKEDMDELLYSIFPSKYLKNKIPDYQSHKIYFDFGTLGLDSLYEPYQLLVDSIMIENGYTKNKNWVTKKYFDEDHNEDFWRARFHIPIDFFFN